MRDLANQGILRRRKYSAGGSRILLFFVIGFIAVSVIGALLNGLGGNTSAESEYLKDAPNGLTPVEVSGAEHQAESGINLSSGTINLRPVKSGEVASGTASRTYGGGFYSLSVTATLPDPKGGDKYQVWLTDGTSNVDAGFMSGSKTSWTVNFRDKDKYASFKTVWVTREITSEDGKPEQKVLIGSF